MLQPPPGTLLYPCRCRGNHRLMWGTGKTPSALERWIRRGKHANSAQALPIKYPEHLPLRLPIRRQLVILQPGEGQRFRLPTGEQGQHRFRRQKGQPKHFPHRGRIQTLLTGNFSPTADPTLIQQALSMEGSRQRGKDRRVVLRCRIGGSRRRHHHLAPATSPDVDRNQCRELRTPCCWTAAPV